MKLYIDSRDRNKIVVKLDAEEFETEAKDGASQRLLPFIDEILKKKKVKFEDLKGIEVATGHGSFTGIRVGVAIANALAYSLNIPVNGKRMETEIHYEDNL